MTKVVGVRFRNVGKIYYFSPKDYEIKTGDRGDCPWNRVRESCTCTEGSR